MLRGSVGWIDVLWGFFAACFFLAFAAHKVSARRRWDGCYLHVLFQDLIRYGQTKHGVKRDERLRLLDVPKRWFWHFYAVSVCWNGFLLVLTSTLVYRRQPYPAWLAAVIDTLTGVPAGPDSQVPQASTLLLQLLLCVHSLRRLLECLCVSVFSDGGLHPVQYVFGLVYYVVLGLTVHCTDRTGGGGGSLAALLDWLPVAGIVLFTGASLLQHHSMVLLAGLRTGKSGAVETLAHKVPNGGGFELISCPHYFAELLIYISLSLISGGASLTWWVVVLYVLLSQALAAQLCHELYTSKYESYPKHRRAFIPFVL